MVVGVLGDVPVDVPGGVGHVVGQLVLVVCLDVGDGPLVVTGSREEIDAPHSASAQPHDEDCEEGNSTHDECLHGLVVEAVVLGT